VLGSLGGLAGAVIPVFRPMAGLCASVLLCGAFAAAAGTARSDRTVSLPVSIVFVIDNSGSMGGGALLGSDPDGSRFRIAMELLDSIRLAAPGSEAGLVVFSNRLFFDDRDDAFFKPAFPSDTSQHDAYAPLTDLNGLLPDGRKGVDTLKGLLQYTNGGDLVHTTQRPRSRANSANPEGKIRDGTDITLAFQAAKQAMAASKHPKERQVILFLSDGEPSGVDDSRKSMENDFIIGEGVPKTLVVFYKGQSANPTAPQSIVSMVSSIRANGYSAANPKSAYFAVNLPGTQLLTLLLEGIQDGTSLRRRERAFARAPDGYRIFTIDGRRVALIEIPNGALHRVKP
jgi:hypothetical protein